MQILHVALEYKKGVGGVRSVTNALLPSLAKKLDEDISIVTPFFDFFQNTYPDITLVATIAHTYKGIEHTSNIYRACSETINEKKIFHYLIRPNPKSPVAWIFNVGDEKKIYQPFSYSEPQNRWQYFNSAVAAMVRCQHTDIPVFDIVHTHAWHTSLSLCLIKEYENLKSVTSRSEEYKANLRKIPHLVATVHMLYDRDVGQVSGVAAVKALVSSVGLPDNFENTVFAAKKHITNDQFKQLALSLIYADHVTIVSKGAAKEALNGKGHGLDDLLINLANEGRFTGITNGIAYKNWDPTCESNLQELVFDMTSVNKSKQRIKLHLADQYAQLNVDKPWFLFVGRFAEEKGIDMLIPALEAIRELDANLIVMGIRVSSNLSNKENLLIEVLKTIDDVIVIDDPLVQKEIGNKMRAACEFTLIPSHNETCGLVPMESIASGSMPITSDIQGLVDTVIPFSADLSNGTGFMYSEDETSRYNGIQNSIKEAFHLYSTWKCAGILDSILKRMVENAKDYDWNNIASESYIDMYRKTISRDLILCNQIRNSSPKKIFQIGFNKAGTTTLEEFFIQNKIPCIHYGGGILASLIQENHQNNQPLLSPQYLKFSAFLDIENIYADPPIYVAQQFFKQLDQQYPGSKFILNTRDKSAWLRSRAEHNDIKNQQSYMDVLCTKYNLSPEGLIQRWSTEWDEHHAAAREYFKDRPSDFLEFNIELDLPEKLSTFLAPDFFTDPNLYGHFNKTNTATSTRKLGLTV